MPMLSSTEFQLHRHPANPVLGPDPAHAWESLVATNPGAWFDADRGEVLLLYRAAGDDADHVVRLALARSRDGVHFTRDPESPVAAPIPFTPDGGCLEDPRVVKIGEWYYVTVAARPFPPGQYWDESTRGRRPHLAYPSHFPAALRLNLTSTHLFLTRDFKSWIRAGRLTDAAVDDRDVVIFPETVGGKWITLHRPMQWHGVGFPNPQPAIWIARSDDLLGWKELHLLAMASYDWELKVGANNPPLRTPHGWLQIYHAVGPDRHYRLGALLLDLDDPSRVTHRTRRPIYEPIAEWETRGLYNGVCFPCGHAVLDGVYHLYYGGGDRVCGLATAPLADLLEHVLAQPAW